MLRDECQFSLHRTQDVCVRFVESLEPHVEGLGEVDGEDIRVSSQAGEVGVRHTAATHHLFVVGVRSNSRNDSFDKLDREPRPCRSRSAEQLVEHVLDEQVNLCVDQVRREHTLCSHTLWDHLAVLSHVLPSHQRVDLQGVWFEVQRKNRLRNLLLLQQAFDSHLDCTGCAVHELAHSDGDRLARSGDLLHVHLPVLQLSVHRDNELGHVLVPDQHRVQQVQHASAQPFKDGLVGREQSRLQLVQQPSAIPLHRAQEQFVGSVLGAAQQHCIGQHLYTARQAPPEPHC
mmetsp:Transcript_23635/g.46549  ORF Transcript_23635/g.46549 Transcript_23635/m.46549 type:complete len:288 (-) Transcript_23635:1450-2313(-)